MELPGVHNAVGGYEPPEIRVLGTLWELTAGGVGRVPDALPAYGGVELGPVATRTL